jgi:hypothetical protein
MLLLGHMAVGADDLGVGCTTTRAISRLVLGRQARAPPLNVENRQNVRLRGKGNVLQPRGELGIFAGTLPHARGLELAVAGI